MHAFQHAFEQSPSRMLVLTPAPPFLIRAATDWYYDATLTGPEILGHPMFKVFPDNPSDRGATGVERLKASFDRALARQVSDTMPVQRYDIRDRSRRFLERYWTPINRPVFSGGLVTALVHRVEDVTHLIREGELLLGDFTRLNEKLEMRAHELALANALRDEVEQRRRISAIVAHDLRDPLAIISTGLHVLRSHYRALGAPEPRTVDILAGAAARMERMVNDLGDYCVSQIRGLLPVARQRVGLRAICDEVVRAMQVTYPDRRFELEPGPELAASVDPMRIRQVLTNLLNNALTYGDPRRPVVVTVHRVTGGFEMTVSNEGAPIPEHVLPTLFQPFRRGPGTGNAPQQGHLGLGLYIVQQIVQAHEGGISVESTPRRTRFTIFIPIS